MIGQFGARIEGNIKLSKFFDEMRLLRSLRPLRLLRLMPRKSLNVQSPRCHTQQKCINKLKTLENVFESCFTFGTFKLFFTKHFLEFLHTIHTAVAWREKKCKHFGFYKYFSLVLGLLESRISEKIN